MNIFSDQQQYQGEWSWVWVAEKAAKEAFTLIELLIVVAVIAIMAAIAVPNIREAQTRSKTA